MDPRRRVLARRVVVVAVVVAQLGFLVRGYHSPHRELGWQMFPESTEWQAEVVRVLDDGRRVPVGEPWPGGYTWATLVRGSGLSYPDQRQHADAGLAAVLDDLEHALAWVAANTPADTETRRLDAVVRTWRNDASPGPEVRLTSPERR
ncbi:MAG: hypothetical protein ACKO91_17140 [Acidimicrobiales bacterium]